MDAQILAAALPADAIAPAGDVLSALPDVNGHLAADFGQALDAARLRHTEPLGNQALQALNAVEAHNLKMRDAVDAAVSQDDGSVLSSGALLRLQSEMIQATTVNEIAGKVITQAAQNIDQLTHVQ